MQEWERPIPQPRAALGRRLHDFVPRLPRAQGLALASAIAGVEPSQGEPAPTEGVDKDARR